MASDYEEAFGDWLVDTVQVATYQGTGPKGAVLAPAVPVDRCLVNYGERLVRASTEDSRVSDAQITTVLEHAAAFAPESVVTLPDGQKRTVLKRAVDRPQVPLAHVRVVLV